jgi:hypothetical protein
MGPDEGPFDAEAGHRLADVWQEKYKEWKKNTAALRTDRAYGLSANASRAMGSLEMAIAFDRVRASTDASDATTRTQEHHLSKLRSEGRTMIATTFRAVDRANPGTLLAELGNVFFVTAALDAVNWKRVGRRPWHDELVVDSWGKLLCLLLESPDSVNLDVLADFIRGNRGPYGERDFDDVVRLAHAFVDGADHGGVPEALVAKLRRYLADGTY